MSSAIAELQSLTSELAPPPSIVAALTAVPPEYADALTNLALYSSLQAEFKTSIPSWFTALPSGAQSYVEVYQSAIPVIASLESVAGIGAGYTGTGPNPTGTAYSSSSGSSSAGSAATSTVATPA